MKKISVFVVCICMLMAVGCSKSIKITVKENVELEYGEKLNNFLLFDKEQSDEDITVKEVKNFDSKKIGEQEITVIFTNADEKTKEEKLKVTIKDTKKPVIKLKKDKLEITEGDKFDAATNIESVKDPIDGNIKKSDDKKLTKNGYLITSDVNANKAGSYTVKITAFDVNGNKAESSYKVPVKTKPQEPVAQQPAYQPSNQSSGNSGYINNQGSSSSNNSAPVVNNTPAPQPSTNTSGNSSISVNKPHVHSFPYPTGYDDVYIYEGQYFDSLAESDTFANDYWGPNGDWSGKGWGGTECSCGKTRLYFHHITYFEK